MCISLERVVLIFHFTIWCISSPKSNELKTAKRLNSEMAHSDLSVCVCSCSEGSVHHTVAEVVRFVEERIKEEEGKESHSLRGPYLARLELLHRLRERGCPEESLLGNNTNDNNVCRKTALTSWISY